MIGSVIGRLTVTQAAGKDRKRNLLWRCLCTCGSETIASGWRLRKGEPQSCGCLQREVTTNRNTSHGMTGTRLYTIWSNMLSRCGNEKNPQFCDYGGRGISVCEEWSRFEPFSAWAKESGYSDSLSIDRVNNDGNYGPGNCRWVTMLEQAHNKRPRRDQKLTDAQIEEIRNDSRPQHEIAATYSIQQQHVSRIKSGKRRAFQTGERKMFKVGNEPVQQGECRIVKIDRLPENMATKKAERVAKGFVISHSESGHHHVLTGGEVMERIDKVPAGMQQFYAILDAPEMFIQDAANPHGGYDLDPGIYRFDVSREFDPFAEQARRVAD